ncbi:hypothetical protein MBLNU230_g2784t1 [Neophaeotheca triangularis]
MRHPCSRIRALRSRPNVLHHISCIQLLVLLLNLFALSMVITQTILFFELPMNTSLAACRAAIYVCLPFYFIAKLCMQLFLLERLHIIRWKYSRRLDDWLWVTSTAVIVLGFGAITIVAMLFPIAKLAGGDNGRCHIGLPYRVTIPLLTYDILINIALTGVFIALLWPLLRLKKSTSAATTPSRRYPSIAAPTLHRQPLVQQNLRGGSSRYSSSSSTSAAPSSKPPTDTSARPPTCVELLPLHDHHGPPSQQPRHQTHDIAPASTRPGPGEARDHRLRSLVTRTLVGGIVVLVPTIVNLTLLYRFRGEEQGWMCYLLCMSDVAFQVVVLHFLTMNGKDEGVDG